MDQSQILTDKERKEIDKKQNTSICQCGHKKSEHNKFINGLFVGCFECDCQKFKWSIDNA